MPSEPGPAVFAVFPRSGGEPYIARTGDLRRRLRRLLRKRERLTSLLNLREVAERIEYWPTGSSLESLLVWYECGRLFLPDNLPALTQAAISALRTVTNRKPVSAHAGQLPVSLRPASATVPFDPERLQISSNMICWICSSFGDVRKTCSHRRNIRDVSTAR